MSGGRGGDSEMSGGGAVIRLLVGAKFAQTPVGEQVNELYNRVVRFFTFCLQCRRSVA